MSAKGSSSVTVSHGSDFATNSRLVMLSAFGLLIGVMSTLGAAALLAAIRFFTNLFFFGRFSLAMTSPADNRLGLVVVAIPALGGLIVGLMARYGSEKIRVKAVIWAVALGSGTSGGVLAPLLMIGAGLGSVLGTWLPGGSPQLWALVCMAAILGGTMRAPLTAVVFAFGLTHDVNAFLPTILSCAIAYGFTVIVMPRSILTEKIARRGRHVFREYGVDPLERHFVDEVMTRAVVTISGSQRASEVLGSHFGTDQAHRAYPVMQDHRLFAMVDRSILNALSPEALELPLAESLAGRSAKPFFALPSDTCRAVALRLAALGLERLPVVDDSVSRRLVGLVSRSDLLKPSHVVHDEDVRRERVFGFFRRSPER